SRFLIHTLKEAPADAEIISHQLMIRSGMIQRIAAGIYAFMPLGVRVMRKIEAIVRGEMNRAGALEALMPMVQPAGLWRISQRLARYGPELLRFKDRHARDFVLGPTHEEVVTEIARAEIRSYRQLPLILYQIQSKFRDEIRPRFGVMRAREFVMKDAYSFDRDAAGLARTYQRIFDAYQRIFTRLGLNFRAVAADNGAIGGSGSHEFHVIAETGEAAIAYCPASGYAANVEAAPAPALLDMRAPPRQALVKAATPGKTACREVAPYLSIPVERTVKSLVLAVEKKEKVEDGPEIWLLLLRGDHSLNEVKAGNAPQLSGYRFASEREIREWFGAPPGYLGPLGAREPVRILADCTVARMSDFVVGANEEGFHWTGVNWGRDLPEPETADLRDVVEGDLSPDGKGRLSICRGIEVGHIFQLGTRYSDIMGAHYLDDAGVAQPLAMGCYGIGITRLLGAAIEQNFDARGILWPAAIAPFEAVLCPMGYHRSEAVRHAADRLYATLTERGADVMLDDRNERAGVMFADWELIGIPHRLVISERGLKENTVEYQGRDDACPTSLTPEQAVAHIVGARNS
ncbi:proline--tRNA ligase, partial [Candidatus Glomeribacter gigasporarum]|uniref:proline--tRNA ligase n=1 Tax=Candidatus Glomeribacter gigasporarum TaxID=132144 RepID=UPI0009DA85E4